MKKIYLLWSLAIATLMVNVFYACKSDDTLEEFYRKHGLTLNPTQDPDFVIYSNGNVLATTLGTRSEFGTRGESDAACIKKDMTDYPSATEPAAITDDERAYVKQWFENNPGLTEGLDIHNFYIQHVWGQSNKSYKVNYLHYDQNYITNHPGATSNYYQDDYDDRATIDYLEVGDGTTFTHVLDLNANDGGPHGIVYMKNSSALKFRFHSTWGDNRYYDHFKCAEIDVPGVGKGWYVGLAMYGEKYDNGNRILNDYEKDYADDWILKIVPGEGEIIPGGKDEGDDDALLVFSFSLLVAGAQTYESYIEQGLAAVQEKRYDEAIEQFRQALRTSPDDIRNALTYANIAHVQELKGEQMQAINSYDMALGIAPLNVPILKSQADLFLTLGNLSKALLNYSKILDVAPNNTDALLSRAYIYQQQRNYQSAKTDYERLLTLQPNNYAALLGVAILFQNANKPQEALSRLTLLIDQYPEKAELYSIRAEIEAEAHQPELAIMDLDKAISLEPENKNMILTRAYLHLKEGRKYQAKQDFQRAIQLGVPQVQLKEELKQCK